MLAGHLLSQGIQVQREKLRASIHRVDPTGTAERRSVAVRRRVYHVDAANDAWHIDGNHKLIASFIRIPGHKAAKELICCDWRHMCR